MNHLVMNQTVDNSNNSSVTIVAENYLGNLNDLSEQKESSSSEASMPLLVVTIDRKDRCKGRIFTTSESGQPVGIVKGRDWLLKDGDILAAADHQRVLIRIQPQQVITLQVDHAHNAGIQLIHLGHVLGNHHWPITVQGNKLYIEMVTDADLIISTIREVADTLNLQGITVTQEEKSAEHALDFSSFETDTSARSSAHTHTHAHSHAH
ncbi:MAG: urease accessory protein UreE [Cyanobacteria bacterium J06632_3]